MKDKTIKTEPKKPAMCPMVGWFDPRQLARTAVDVFVSTLFGHHSDYRLTEALLAPDDRPESIWEDDPIDTTEEHDELYDYSNSSELWIDYIADSGSGWNPTYAVAYHATQPVLPFQTQQADETVKKEETKRGSILVFGGDQVYPVANRKSYRERLVEPFEAALRNTKPPHPRVFAIPGNHDWYDSLVSFTRLFCSRRWFAGWRTRQSRSYFALKLPHNWWLVGTDVQLASDIDVPQVKYFRRIARQMTEDDRIIMCTAEPHWIYAGMYNKFDAEINENNLAFLDRKVFAKQEIAAYLSGDLHHYRRHENKDRVQKITAGGGGAHTFPTHGANVDKLAEGFELRRPTFPSEEESKKITWRNLFFLYHNPWFFFVPALLYLLTSWSVMADVGHSGISAWFPALKEAISTSIGNPGAVFWILLVWGGFIMFTDTPSKKYRFIAGSLHGLTHLLCIFLIGWGATYAGMTGLGYVFKQPKQLLLAGVVIFVVGGVVGSIVMGLYLLVSLNFFGRHLDEGFSSLHIEDWKGFLRLHINSSGQLTIFPIGIKRVPRHWEPAPRDASSQSRTEGASPQDSGPEYVPKDDKASPPILIEPSITI